jgi:hypothetical protein
MATFRKGDAVTFFNNWDQCGTIRVVDLTVYSAGKIQMILVDAKGQKFEGRNFQPTVVQGVNTFSEVHPRMTADAAHAYALKLGARVVAWERERMEECIATEVAHYGATQMVGYVASVRKSLDKLHEPRVVREGD